MKALLPAISGAVLAAVLASGPVRGQTASASTAPSPASRPAEGVAPYIRAIQQASDPSAAVAAYAGGFAVDRASVALHEAYINRMIDFGMPALAYHQAEVVASLEPRSGLARAVLAFVNAKKGLLADALSDAVQAAELAPDHPFVQRTVGELLAWYSRNFLNLAIPDSLKKSLETTLSAMSSRAIFAQTYEEARKALEQAAGAAPAATGPAATRPVTPPTPPAAPASQPAAAAAGQEGDYVAGPLPSTTFTGRYVNVLVSTQQTTSYQPGPLAPDWAYWSWPYGGAFWWSPFVPCGPRGPFWHRPVHRPRHPCRGDWWTMNQAHFFTPQPTAQQQLQQALAAARMPIIPVPSAEPSHWTPGAGVLAGTRLPRGAGERGGAGLPGGTIVPGGRTLPGGGTVSGGAAVPRSGGTVVGRPLRVSPPVLSSGPTVSRGAPAAPANRGAPVVAAPALSPVRPSALVVSPVRVSMPVVVPAKPSLPTLRQLPLTPPPNRERR